MPKLRGIPYNLRGIVTIPDMKTVSQSTGVTIRLCPGLLRKRTNFPRLSHDIMTTTLVQCITHG